MEARAFSSHGKLPDLLNKFMDMREEKAVPA